MKSKRRPDRSGRPVPIAQLRDAGSVVVTDFTSLAKTFADQYAGKAFLYQP